MIETTVPIDDEEGVDRLSNLPEHFIHQIMSFLPATDVAITSALSKKFNSLWRSFPIIDFDQNLFIEKSGMFARNTFLDFVVGSIQLRQLESNLEKFSLKCSLGTINSDPQIDMAINFALNNNVQDLCLNFPGNVVTTGNVRYLLKESLDLKSVSFLKLKGFELNLNSLVSAIPLMQSLTLCYCFDTNINPSGNTPSTIGQSLRIMSINDVNITDNWVEKYIPKFLKLEILRIRRCRTLQNIQFSCENLTEIELIENFNLASIEIVAAQLVSFHIGRVREECTIDISACTLLKNLSLTSAYVTDDWLISQVLLLSRLEKLRLENCVKLVRVHITSPSLRMLELRDCGNLVEVRVDAPNLVGFEYCGVLVYISLMNSPRLRNPILTIMSDVRSDVLFPGPKIYVPPNNVWFGGLRDFLTMFDHCEALTLVCGFYQDIIFPAEVKDSTISPLCDIKSLHIKSSSAPNIKPELVDSLLWISPMVETMSFASESVEKIIKLRYEKKKRKNINTFCCYRVPIKCWRHYLKAVTMRGFDQSDDTEGLIDYFKKECQLSGNSLPHFGYENYSPSCRERELWAFDLNSV